MDYMYDLKDMLCRELEELTKKGELSAGDLEAVDKLTHSIKSIVTIMAMEDSGYSNDGSYDSYDRMGNGGSSYARNYNGRMPRRDSMGRYSGRRYYSRDDAKEEAIRHMEKLMDDASGEERKVIQNAVNQLKSL